MPRLTLVIPSHNRADLLAACLASVQRHAPADTQVIVVDDASPNGIIRDCAEQAPGVEILRLEDQSGFCVAANAGIAAARAPLVEVLNDDTEVCGGWAEAALAAFADPVVAAVTPLVLRWPGVDVGTAIVDSAGDDYHVGGFASKRAHGHTLAPEHLRPCDVFGASGSSAFYRRDVLLAVGAFPPSFGAYFEDVDLSFRLHRAGYRVRFEPRSRVLHHVSSSYQPSPELLERQSRNEELVWWRNLPKRQLLAALPLHALVLAAKAWRRWRHGELGPFVRGRFSAWQKLPAVFEDRRRHFAPHRMTGWPRYHVRKGSADPEHVRDDFSRRA